MGGNNFFFPMTCPSWPWWPVLRNFYCPVNLKIYIDPYYKYAICKHTWLATLCDADYYKAWIFTTKGVKFIYSEMATKFCKIFALLFTPSIPEIIWVRNVRAIVVCGFLMKSLKKLILKIWKKSWVPFRSYLLNSTANPAQFEWKWAGLAVLFSR